MNIIPQNLTWTADLHREFSQDRAAVRLADRILRDLERAIRKANQLTVAAVALHRAPGLPITDALRALAGEVDAMVAALERFQATTATTLKADQDRLAPLMSAAVRRSFAAVRRIEQIDAQVRSGEQRAQDKREKLRAAGVTGADLDALSKPFDPAPLEAERAALAAEIELLERFLRTKDESILPADFVGAAA